MEKERIGRKGDGQPREMNVKESTRDGDKGGSSQRATHRRLVGTAQGAD